MLPWLSTTVCHPSGSLVTLAPPWSIVALALLWTSGSPSLWLCWAPPSLWFHQILSYQLCSGLPSPCLHFGHTCLLLHFGPLDLQHLPEYMSHQLLLSLQFAWLNFGHLGSWLLLSSSRPWCFPLPLFVLFRNLIFPASVGHLFPVLLMLIPSVFKPSVTSDHELFNVVQSRFSESACN